nr:flagellar basal body rod C-terminal domain-containing protein [Candidatus Kapabacteria bacterium]
DEYENQIALTTSSQFHGTNSNLGEYPPDYSVLNAKTAKDNSEPRLVYDPSHPDANEEGYVEMPNINIVTEMVEMISAQRSFEANSGVVEAAKNVARYSLEI